MRTKIIYCQIWCRNHENGGGSRPFGAVATLAQQQRQHLDGLPQAHVVGKAGTEAQLRYGLCETLKDSFIEDDSQI